LTSQLQAVERTKDQIIEEIVTLLSAQSCRDEFLLKNEGRCPVQNDQYVAKRNLHSVNWATERESNPLRHHYFRTGLLTSPVSLRNLEMRKVAFYKKAPNKSRAAFSILVSNFGHRTP